MVAYLLALMSEKDVNMGRLLLMSLIHDLPESKLGDIPHDPQMDLPDFYKSKRDAEGQIMENLLRELPPQLRSQLDEAWRELCLGESVEARLVKVADQLATALHALQLVKSGHRKDLFTPFFRSAEQAATENGIPQAVELIREMRMSAGL